MQYYYIDNQGQQRGPFSQEQLLGQGVNRSTMVWREGLSQWIEACRLDEFQGFFPPEIPAEETSLCPPPQYSQPAFQSPTDQYVMPGQSKPSNNTTVFIIAGVVAVVIAVACAITFFLIKGNGMFGGEEEYMIDSVAEVIDSVEIDELFEASLNTEKTKRTSYFRAANDDDDPEHPYFYMTKTYDIEWPNVANFDIEPLQRALNNAMFDKNVTSLTEAASRWLKTVKLEDVDLQWEINNSGAKSDEGDDFYFYNWSDDLSCKRITEKMPVNVVGFTTGGYFYTGGAHGTPYQCGIINYDCQNCHVISYNDIFKPGSDQQILNLLRSARKRDSNYDSSFGLPERIPKTEMTIKELGVTFAYSVYEIGSYADGEVEVTLPFSQIETYLTQYGLSLYQR